MSLLTPPDPTYVVFDYFGTTQSVKVTFALFSKIKALINLLPRSSR